MSRPLEPERWYLWRVRRLEKTKGVQQQVLVELECASGQSDGEKIRDKFWLTSKSISRFKAFAHRAGCEREINTQDDVTAQIFAEVLSKKLWARIKENEQQAGVLVTDGWNFRPETDPPEDEMFIDYKAQDEEDRALAGID